MIFSQLRHCFKKDLISVHHAQYYILESYQNIMFFFLTHFIRYVHKTYKYLWMVVCTMWNMIHNRISHRGLAQNVYIVYYIYMDIHTIIYTYFCVSHSIVWCTLNRIFMVDFNLLNVKPPWCSYIWELSIP